MHLSFETLGILWIRCYLFTKLTEAYRPRYVFVSVGLGIERSLSGLTLDGNERMTT